MSETAQPLTDWRIQISEDKAKDEYRIERRQRQKRIARRLAFGAAVLLGETWVFYKVGLIDQIADNLTRYP